MASIVAATPASVATEMNGRRARKRARRESESGEASAVSTLVEWVKKITDAELPVTNAVPKGAPAIFIGQAALEAGLKLDDIQSPTREGIRIAADERRVLIAGQSPAATLKAVCRFLEEMGCRYFMDGPLGEVYPRARTLSVNRLAITEKPGLLERQPKGPSWRTALWKAWNGAGGQALEHRHIWNRYVSAALFSEHPEFFAMDTDGQRRAGQWLCTSNKALRRYFAEQVIAAIRNGMINPSLSPADGRGYCQCPACKAQDDPTVIEPSSGTVSVSARYADFFDDVARQVAKVYPKSVLSFYCYADYTQPPRLGHKLAPNLCPVIAPIRYCRLHGIGHPGCPSREQQTEIINGWAQLAPRLGYYNYMYNLADATLPMFKFSACKKEFPYLTEKGVEAMTIEVLSNWHIYGPQIYLSLRLAYDPQADASAIMADYWEKFYGPKVAPHMKRYWMGIDAETEKLRSHAGGFFGLQQIYTPEFLQRCENALAGAAAAVKDEAVYAERVALHREGFRSAVEYRRICEEANAGNFAEASRIYERMVSRLRGLADKGWANPKYATAYLERFLGGIIQAGAAATASPGKVLEVLRLWRFSFDETDRGVAAGWHKTDFDDTRWHCVSAGDKTLDAQGFDKTTILWYRSHFQASKDYGRLSFFFAQIDGFTEVYVNGRKVEPASAPRAETGRARKRAAPENRPRAPFEVDITSMAHSGDNVLALRIDHTRMTELALGGILRPVVLIQKSK